MTYVQISAWFMLVFSGAWAGVILTFEVERINLWARMPMEQYAVDFRRSLFRVDPMQPILAAVASVAAGVFAWNRAGAAMTLAWIGLALMVVVVVASVAIAEPINSKFRRLPEGQVPDDAERLRTSWRRFHGVRNVVSLVAFGLLAAAAIA